MKRITLLISLALLTFSFFEANAQQASLTELVQMPPEDFKIGPIPVDDRFVVFSGQVVNQVTVFDAAGKVIYYLDQSAYNPPVIFKESLTPGIYVVEAKINQTLVRKKIVAH